MVILADGRTKPIEQIKPYDKIIAYDTIAYKNTTTSVEKLLIHNDKKYSISNLKFSNNTDLKITDP